ncbi:neuraminidase-like domain-containing protein [Pseudomonas migulae]|uniref:Tc toxin subunit A-related protein n=1 Tax=Pseudomonas migulae TaxID=78543 RepID=UPI0037232D38
MTVAIKKQLDESLRDALLAYYLAKVAPTKNPKFKSAEDLYEYWLLDVLVSQDVPTTPVACAIASLQQYINRILLRMEPGYGPESITPDQVQLWRNEMHQYRLWAAHQKLMYFPSMYLDPSLKENKSDNFQQLENDLNQNRIQPDAVQAAVLAYLTRFEEIANLNILNGYIDGDDFANSTYYFIAKSRSEHTYFWRSLNMAQRPFNDTATQATSPKRDQPEPYAWSDWEKADIPIPNDAVEHSIRPVWFNNRLFIIWAECIGQDPAAVNSTSSLHGDSTAHQRNPLLRLNLSYKKPDGSWSTPRTCLQGYSDDKALRDKDLNSIRPLIDSLAIHHQKESNDLLFVALRVHKDNTGSTGATENDYTFLKTAVIDKNLDIKPGISEPAKDAAANDQSAFHKNLIQVLHRGRQDSAQLKSRLQFKTHVQSIHWAHATPYSTDTTLWNFNGHQSQISSESNYDKVNSSFTLELTTQHKGTVLLILNTPPESNPALELFLILPDLDFSTTAYVEIGPGSTLTLTAGVNYDQNNALSLGGNLNIINVLRDESTSASFTLNRGADISGKFISTAALRHLINLDKSQPFSISIRNRLDSWTFDQVKVFYSTHLYARHIIYRKSNTHEKINADYSNLTVVAQSLGAIHLKDNFSHTWQNDEISKEGETFYYGVAWSRPDEGQNVVFSALKAITLKSPLSATSRQPPEITSNVTTPLGTVQTIDFSSSEIRRSDGSQQPRQSIRLNTAFTAELIRRTENSLDELFSRETQHLPEPALSGEVSSKMDFHGPYGRYFTELFLYLPWLIAHRLNTEHQYDEAERWIRYVFDPGNQSEYWGAEPLTGPDVPSYSEQAPQDPHQIALSHPVHFRKALYFLYLDILINRGDAAYRELTPDSLGEAKLWYARALDLLGPRPVVQRVDQWSDVSLQTLSETTSEGLRTFEKSLAGSSLTLQGRKGGSRQYVPAIDTPHLHLPFNPALLKRWDIAEGRLYNLRQNLDITGKPLHMPQFAAPLDPRALLGTHSQSDPGDVASGLPSAQIPPYRFTAIYSQALNAVESLCQFGATLLSLIERKEQAQLQELQQQQVWQLAKMSVDLQTQALRIDHQNRQALLASKAIAQGRGNHYRQLLEKDVSEAEAQASQLYLSSGSAELKASAAQVVAGGMMMIPSIFGFSNGGSRWEGAMHSATALAQCSAISDRTAAANIDRTALFARRREEWTLSRDQAQLELAQIEAQLAHFTEQETATRLQLRLAETTLSQTRATYDFLSKRFTKAQLYQWLNSQFSTLYYQAYDAVLALCLAAEACWQYERADFTTRFIRPGAWSTTYRGLGAGEQLKLSLLKMQSEYLQRNERELEIRKTVSLRQLKEKDSSVNKTWTDIQAGLTKGTCDFELTHAMFEDDYKDQNHYLRRIKTISVSLPALLGPYENIRATLTQTASRVFMAPGDKAPTMESKRASQQVALSTGIDDNGLFTLNFNDERYLPFEYTGAVSAWRLTFPNPEAQKVMLESLTDIIVHVSYTARVGGAQ